MVASVQNSGLWEPLSLQLYNISLPKDGSEVIIKGRFIVSCARYLDNNFNYYYSDVKVKKEKNQTCTCKLSSRDSSPDSIKVARGSPFRTILPSVAIIATASSSSKISSSTIVSFLSSSKAVKF